MAITKSRPQMNVEILSNGVPLQEYEDDDEQDPCDIVTRYIEAKSGAEFAIRYTITRPWPDTAILFDFHLDGKLVRGSFANRGNCECQRHERTTTGVLTKVYSGWVQQNFKFAELTIDDSDLQSADDQLAKTLKGIGTITLKAYEVKNLRETEATPKIPDLNYIGTIPEKALKGRALSHSTSLGAPVAAGEATVFNCDYVAADRKPFATYKFKYRSRDALKALWVIPRSPSPVPLEERDVNTLSPDEMRELLRRQKEREGSARVVKAEGIKREPTRDSSKIADGEDDDDDEVTFVSAKRRKVAITIDEDGVETLDLT